MDFGFRIKRNIEESGQFGKGIITNGKQILLFKNMEIKEEAFYDDLSAYRPNWYFWPGQNFESKSNPIFMKDENKNYRILRKVSVKPGRNQWRTTFNITIICCKRSNCRKHSKCCS